MINVSVNGEALQLAPGTTIQGLLAQLDMATGRVAVEVNADIVPRSTHSNHELQDGDAVEIVHAIGGG